MSLAACGVQAESARDLHGTTKLNGAGKAPKRSVARGKPHRLICKMLTDLVSIDLVSIDLVDAEG